MKSQPLADVAVAPALERIAGDGPAFETHAAFADTSGFVVFDRFVCDRACGGLRVLPDVTVEEIQEQARGMTRKFAFLGIACGGAKSGLIERQGWSDEERGRAFEAFGAAIGPLLRRGVFILGEDMGCRPADLRRISYGAGMAPTPTTTHTSQRGSGHWAGLGTAVATAAALEHAGCRVAGARVAIEGFGRVGRSAALELARRGARLRAVSNVHGAIAGDDLSPHALIDFLGTNGEQAITRFPGARPISPAELFAEDLDALLPCARPAVVHAGNVAALRCRVIAPGGNASVADGLDDALEARGIVVVPDFVANAGGVLVGHISALAPCEMTTAWLMRVWFAGVVRDLLRSAAEQALTPTAAACRRAQANLDRLAQLRRPPAHERLLARLGASRIRRLLPAAAERALVQGIFGRVSP